MTIEERVENLERELARANQRNRLQIITMFCLAIFFLAGLYVAGSAVGQGSVQEEVRSKSFVLVDENGKRRASLCFGEDSGLEFTVTIFLGLLSEEPFLVLYDSNGKGQAVLYAGDSGAWLDLYAIDREHNLQLITGSQGSSLSFEDSNYPARTFLNEGGLLFLTDDFGTGNELLSGINATSRFSGNLLLDLSFEKSSKFVTVFDFLNKSYPLFENVTPFKLIEATIGSPVIESIIFPLTEIGLSSINRVEGQTNAASERALE